jgi:hypothetical protein
MPSGQLTWYQRMGQKKVPNTRNFFSSYAFNGTISQQAPVMSDDETRNKDKMTTAQSNNFRPGAMQPNASISRKLREFYDAVQEEGIPDRFLELLERLDEAEKNAKAVKSK